MCPLWVIPTDCPQLLPLASIHNSILALWVQPGDVKHERPVFLRREPSGRWVVRGLRQCSRWRAAVTQLQSALRTAAPSWTLEDVLPLESAPLRQGKDDQFYIVADADP
eukprot:GGOE01000406.1.p4 GENE.GGOE01000406.1~~GGOE01000406.1.p4  ORF type:complete len:109 (+),score=33.77 GGOE01000406.1:283-609(+)